MKQKPFLQRFSTLLALIAILLASLSCQLVGGGASRSEMATACSQAIADIDSIRAGYGFPDYFDDSEYPAKQGGEFDVMEYFTVLEHLSMQPGYLLNYIYHFDGMGGYPILYAHPESQPPFETEVDFTGEGIAYLDRIAIDGTPEGFLQYAMLNVMGGQFYLWWHAGYNDYQILCDKQAVQDIVSGGNIIGEEVPLQVRLRAWLLSGVEPVVTMEDEQVTVSIVVFTNWGGFFRRTYTISRNFPHTILDMQQEELIPYDCGVMF